MGATCRVDTHSANLQPNGRLRGWIGISPGYRQMFSGHGVRKEYQKAAHLTLATNFARQLSLIILICAVCG